MKSRSIFFFLTVLAAIVMMTGCTSAGKTGREDMSEEASAEGAAADTVSDPETGSVVKDPPLDFVQNQSGVTHFQDYDEIISYLEPGQGYAYIMLIGSDDEILAVTPRLEDDNTSDEAYFYGLKDGKPVLLNRMKSDDMAFPIRYSEGIIYMGDSDEYMTVFVSSEYGTLMIKDFVTRSQSEEPFDYSFIYEGFLRDTNVFGSERKFVGGEEEFEELIDGRKSKAFLKFQEAE
ncbi:MAG: hypothetical protein K6G42_02240 [Lachnospiraceae bacterium]|nr:hypothetical protein [Lachnospiraceae bacterium]